MAPPAPDPPPFAPSALHRTASETFRRNRLLAAVAALHVALFLAFVPLALLDPREVLGVSRWIKPMKFAVSIAIFTATMAWLLASLPGRVRAVRTLSRVIAASMAGEMALITLQAARGVRSHFNADTPFDVAVFNVMGLLIVANTVAAVCAAWLFFRGPVALTGAHLTGVRLGLVLFVLASLEGGLMVSRGAHAVGTHDGGPGLPFVNWSTGGGDLRVAHFAGMHALQGLPLLGWALDRHGVRHGRVAVLGAALAWALATVVLVAQALAGQPLLAAG